MSLCDNCRALCGSQAPKEKNTAWAPRLPARDWASPPAAPGGPGPPHAARLAKGFKPGCHSTPQTLSLCRSGSAFVIQPGHRAYGVCKAVSGDTWVSQGNSTLLKESRAILKISLSEKIIFHTCASEGCGVGPDEVSVKRKNFRTGPTISFPRFRDGGRGGWPASSPGRDETGIQVVWVSVSLPDEMWLIRVLSGMHSIFSTTFQCLRHAILLTIFS